MLDCASQRLAIEQLFHDIVQGDVLCDKQDIILILIACLIEYAMRSSTNIYINKPLRLRLLFSTNMVAFQLYVVKALVMVVEHEESDQTSTFITITPSSFD